MKTLCPQCGAEQPPGEEWSQKVCPACLMKLGLSGAIPSSPLAEPEALESEPQPKPRHRLRVQWNWRWAAFLAGGALLLALVVTTVRHLSERKPVPFVVQFDIVAPNETTLQDFAVSPDGRLLAYTAISEEDPKLWLRALDQLEARELQGTDGASMPFWSPDSRWIGFFAGDKLKTIRVDGGPPANVAGVSEPSGGTWSADGGILFASSAGLQRVAATGGEVIPITTTDGSLNFEWPQFLPDGSHFLFSAMGPELTREIRIGQLQSGEQKRLIQNASRAIYLNGRVLFLRKGFLLSQSLGVARGELSGEPVSVRSVDDSQDAALSAGGNVLAYRSGGTPRMQSLLWLDRNGEIFRAAAEAVQQNGFALSPDQTRVAIVRKSEEVTAWELWVLDVAREAYTRLTFNARDVANPLWAPDGRRVAFTSRVNSATEVQWVATNGSSPELLLSLPFDVVLDSWSTDGRFLAYTISEKGKFSVWMLPLQGDRKPMPFLRGNFNYRQARFSPDGRLVAYVSDESGRNEVYIRSFPAGDLRWLVSTDGGTEPSWRSDGRELFYLARRQQLNAVDIRGGEGGITLASPHVMLKMPRHTSGYRVTNDGQRFLVAVQAQEHERSPIHVVVNWRGED